MFKNAKIVGVNANAAEYHKQPGQRGSKEFVVSSSSLRLFAQFPSKWRAGYEMPASASLEYGSLFDVLVLTPGQFKKHYAIQPEKYQSKGMRCPQCGTVSDSAKCRECKKEREETLVEKDWNNNSDTCRQWVLDQKAKGIEIISPQDYNDADSARKRLFADQPIKRFLDACEKQVWVTAEWHDEDTGIVIPVKCLIDLVSREDSAFPKSIGDLKSTRNAHPIAWAKWASFAGYDIQAAWNTDMFVAATNREIINFCFVLSENFAPWEIGRRFMSQDIDQPDMDAGSIASGRRQYRAILADYCQCLKTDKWPGFDDTDEASADGWTLVVPNPYDEQRRMFAPKYQFNEPGDTDEGDAPEESGNDLTP